MVLKLALAFASTDIEMVLHTGKAIRALGVAESFSPKAAKSTLAGVVVRTDLVVDGFVLGAATVGGDDATRAVLGMFRRLGRDDVNVLMLAGCVISRYNIVDLDGLARLSGVPVVCLTYNESRGIVGSIRRNFPDSEEKVESYKRLGRRSAVRLSTGHKVYVRNSGIDDRDAKKVLDAFTLQGGVPEPVRLAKLLARAAAARP